jgi:hypothetical protein
MDYRRTSQQNYGLFAQYGDPILAVDLSPAVSVGASAEWELGPKTRLDLRGAHEYVPDTGERRESISASARCVIGNGHEVGVRTQLIESGSGSAEAGLFVSYSIPFGLPAGKKRGFASIQGRIYDQDDRLGFGVSKAVVSLGREFKTVTATDGSFSFSGLQPGAYLVEVEPRSIGFGRIVAATSPVVVVAKPDTSTRLEVGVTAGATMEVVITIFEDSIPIAGSSRVPESERYRPMGPAVGEVVEIQADKVVRRLMTDTLGIVRFSGLQSGLWTVRAGQGALPPNHYLEAPLLTRKLRPGATERVEFRVLPRKRVLRFIDDG